MFSSTTIAISDNDAMKMTGGCCVYCETISPTCEDSDKTCYERSTCTGSQFENDGPTSRRSCRAGGSYSSCTATDHKSCGINYGCIMWPAGCGKKLTGTTISVYTDCDLS